MQINAANRRAVREAEKAAKLADERRGNIIRLLTSSQEGREYLWDQLAASHIFQSTYTEDARQSAFLEGERNVGLRLLGDITRYAPEQFIQMMREANERYNTERAVGQQRDGEGRDGDAGYAADGDDRDVEGPPEGYQD